MNLISYRHPVVYKRNILIFFFVFLISFASIFKVPESDLKIYLDYYSMMEGIHLKDVLTSHYLSIRADDHIFKLYTWSVKNIFYQNWLYVFFSVFIIYYSMIKLSIKYAENICASTISRTHVFVILSWCTVVAITFATATHLVRQYLAIALFAYAFMALINKKYFFLSLLLVFSTMVHYFMFIVCLILAVSLMFKSLFTVKLKYLNFFIVFLISFGFSVLFSNIYLMDSLLSGFNYTIPDSENLSYAILVMDSIIVALYLYLYRKNQNSNIIILTSFVIFFIGFLITIHNYNYIFLRFYFVFDLIRAVLGSLIILKINLTPKLVFAPVLIFFFVLYFLLRIYSSPWIFEISHIGA